jgi:hypothetical protein
MIATLKVALAHTPPNTLLHVKVWNLAVALIVFDQVVAFSMIGMVQAVFEIIFAVAGRISNDRPLPNTTEILSFEVAPLSQRLT